MSASVSMKKPIHVAINGSPFDPIDKPMHVATNSIFLQ
jgi:hypothetical protein